MDSITKEWSCLSLFEEGLWFVLNNNLRTQEFIIVVKFLTKCVLNVDVVVRTFKSLWQSQNGFKAKNLGDHILLFIFDNKIEVDKVLLSEPQSFDKYLVVVQYYEKDMPIQEQKFDMATFWVQVHGDSSFLPIF